MKSILLLALILPFAGFSQKKVSGFYGKTFFIEANSALSFPLLNRVSEVNNSGSRFYEPDKVATALNLVVGKAVSQKVSLSLETGVFFGNFSAEDYTYYYSDYSQNNPKEYFYSFENISYRTTTIMPKIEISGTGGNAPGGVSHQIGFGFTSSRIQDKDYEYRRSSDFKDSPDPAIADFKQKYKGYTVLYAVNMRYPISKTLLFNYGIRTTLNLGKSEFYPKSSQNYFVPSSEAEDLIKTTRLRTVFNLQLGFTYLLF